VGRRLGWGESLRAEQVLAVKEHVGVDERREGRDAPVGLGDSGFGSGREVVPVELGAGERLVVEELVERMVPARLPEALLLDVERREERVDPAGVRRHLDGHLLPSLDLRQGFPLDLHSRQRLELGDVLLKHADEGMLGQEQEELLALKALPGEALCACRRRDERPRGRGGGDRLQERAACRATGGHRGLSSRRHRSADCRSAQGPTARARHLLFSGPEDLAMRFRPFGRTGLQVSALGFGCWPMAGDRYGAIEDDEAVKAIHRALDKGVNCVDTAPAYGGGHSEEGVARALEAGRRAGILGTRCGVKPPAPGQPGPLRDSSRANIFREIDLSLKRLRTDWVDVLLVHWPDAATPFEETMRALEEVVTSGRARFVGVSNFTGAMIAECLPTRRVDVSQVGYHMFDRRQEAETFPLCLEHGIGVMGYGSLGQGLLTGAFTAATTFGEAARDWRGGGVAFGQPIFRGDNFQKNVAVVDRLRREVAEPRGVPVSQIALAWVLGHPAISTALVGARTPAEVDANDAGAELDLSPAERAKIDAIIGGVAGRVREYSPLRPAMEPWGEEIPAGKPSWGSSARFLS